VAHRCGDTGAWPTILGGGQLISLISKMVVCPISITCSAVTVLTILTMKTATMRWFAARAMTMVREPGVTSNPQTFQAETNKCLGF
jgi:hypothetical protein